MACNPILNVDNLNVIQQGKTLVSKFSLALQPGLFYGLLGPNGAGKTTVLRVLYRAIKATSGEITLKGRNLNSWSRPDWTFHMGALVQEGSILSGLSVLEVIEIGFFSSRIDTKERMTRIDEALEITGLKDMTNQDAGQLSGGEQQRVYIAQLLARNPDIYILDEPNNHLDLYYQLILLDEIKRRNKTVLATFHDLNLAVRYCDEVTLMANTEKVGSGPPNQMLSPDNLRTIYRVEGALRDKNIVLKGPAKAISA